MREKFNFGSEIHDIDDTEQKPFFLALGCDSGARCYVNARVGACFS